MSSIQTPTEIEIRSTLAEYLTLLQTQPTAEQIVAAVVTPDFSVGIDAGPVWSGVEGLREYLETRRGRFDELQEVKELLEVAELPAGETEVRTRLEFFWRTWHDPEPFSQEFTGWAYHTWRLRQSADGTEFRVAEQIAERFEHLNDNAEKLLARFGRR